MRGSTAYFNNFKTCIISNKIVNTSLLIIDGSFNIATACFSLQRQTQTLPGDMLLVTAFISYVGCFTRKYRLDLMHKDWVPFVGKLKVNIYIT